MKKLFAFGLVLALCLCPALAAGTDAFPKTRDYPGFEDVAGNWCEPYVKSCYEAGLMQGTDQGFQPLLTLDMAQCATIAANIHCALNQTSYPTDTVPWYRGAVEYLAQVGYTVEDPTDKAARWEFCEMLGAVLPEEQLAAINQIAQVPDTDHETVLRFYNAGILTGTNDYGTFNAAGTLTRAECSAIVARIIDPALRKTLTLKEASPEDEAFSLSAYFMGLAPDTTYFTHGELSITTEDYLSNLIGSVDLLVQACVEQNVEFSWSNTIGGQDFPSYAYQQASALSIYNAWNETYTPTVTQADVTAAEVQSGLLKAKHILVSELEAANMVYDALQRDPSQFDTLLMIYGEDPGMESNPGGYVFGPGEMVSEFENGTKALDYNQISAPIQSAYGYHIILRLPLTTADLEDTVKEAQWQAFLSETSSTFSPSFRYLVSVQTVYDRYLDLIGTN